MKYDFRHKFDKIGISVSKNQYCGAEAASGSVAPAQGVAKNVSEKSFFLYLD